jgi:hypothetical protein
MRVIKIILILFFSLRSGNINGQVSLNNSPLTGVKIIAAVHQTPLAQQTELITQSIISKSYNNVSKPFPYSFNMLNIEGKYLPTLSTCAVSTKHRSYDCISDFQKNFPEI